MKNSFSKSSIIFEKNVQSLRIYRIVKKQQQMNTEEHGKER